MAALLFTAIVTTEVATAPRGSFPARLDSYLTSIKLNGDERRRILSGEPVTKLLDADRSKEIAVFGAVWINAPIRRYVDAVTDIETLERGGGFKITKRVSAPPRLEDFSALQLPDEDLASLRKCRVGACDVKLGEQGLQRFQSEINWSAPNARATANALMRRLALEYVIRYLEGGNQELAVYLDKSRPHSSRRNSKHWSIRYRC